MAPDVFGAAISKFLNIVLIRAADHNLGKGLKTGLHLKATMAWLRDLKSLNSNIKCMPETVLSRVTWPTDRIHGAGPEPDPE